METTPTPSTRRQTAAAIMLTATLAACAAPVQDGGAVPIGRRVAVGGPVVTPLAILEDSRCPTDATCVWAGRLIVRTRVALGSGTQVHDLTLGSPIRIADGTLALVEAIPEPRVADALRPRSYRLTYRFAGGL